MKEPIRLGPNLSVPGNVVTKKLGFIGISGSGKTYAAGKFVEELLYASAQVVIVDVIGNWWGLRVAKDGVGQGIKIPVLGGQRGDIPLEPTGGKLVADAIVDTGSSMVLDISELLQGEQRRFVTDFATQLLHRKRRRKGPIHVVWEECQDVLPEYAPGDVARCVGAVARLAKQGRNFGVGSTFITQRPQAVAKEVLNQIECLFMFNTNGPQEMDALVKWVGRTVPKHALDPLKKFANHECLVWSPAWLDRFDQARFHDKWTFDASATPDEDEGAGDVAMKPLDIGQLATAMAETIERAKQEDPAALRAELAKLRHENTTLRKGAPAQVVAKTVRVLTSEDTAELQRLTNDLDEVALEAASLVSTAGLLKESYAGLARRVESVLNGIKERRTPTLPTPPHFDRSPLSPAAPPHFQADGPRVPKHRVMAGELRAEPPPGKISAEFAALRKGAREMLKAVATQYPRAATRGQVAMLAGLTESGGTFSSYLSDLRKAGFVDESNGDGLRLSKEGMAALGGLPEPATHDSVMALWKSKLRKGAREMLDVVVASYPNDIARDELASKVGLEASAGTFSSYLSDLRTSGCMQDTTRGRVRASDNLFPS